MAGTRPGGVTLVSILAWISGILQVITGIVLLLAAGVANLVAIAAWISIILGIITIAVGLGLWRGVNVARILATIVFILNIVSAVWGIFQPDTGWVSPLVSGVLSLIGVILLWTKPANDFFRS